MRDAAHFIRLQHRRGFSLALIVVSLAIMAIMAAIAAPLLFSADDQAGAQQTAEILNSLKKSITYGANDATGSIGFCTTVTLCPARLSQLTNKIVAGDRCCCMTATAVNFAAAQVTTWLTRAPFSGLAIVPNIGLWTPMGIIHDSLVRNTATAFELHIDSVPQYKAIYLDSLVDGAVNATAGAVQYALSPGTTAAKNFYLIKFVVTGAICP
jgi:hypothetical protein